MPKAYHNYETRIQKVCIAQNDPESDERRALHAFGFTNKDIKETDTADLTVFLQMRMINMQVEQSDTIRLGPSIQVIPPR
jgi:hypothetical protein